MTHNLKIRHETPFVHVPRVSKDYIFSILILPAILVELKKVVLIPPKTSLNCRNQIGFFFLFAFFFGFILINLGEGVRCAILFVEKLDTILSLSSGSGSFEWVFYEVFVMFALYPVQGVWGEVLRQIVLI